MDGVNLDGSPLQDSRLSRLRDELGSSQSSPLLQEVATKLQQDSSQLQDQILRPKSVRDSIGLEGTSSLKELGELGVAEEGMKRTSSFADLLESREMDQAWLEMQVSSYQSQHIEVGL